jgi:hypothetical protein
MRSISVFLFFSVLMFNLEKDKIFRTERSVSVCSIPNFRYNRLPKKPWEPFLKKLKAHLETRESF